MSSDGNIPFRKMNGLGNDFVVIDGRARPIVVTEAMVRAASDRSTGVGCDQFILMDKSSFADIRMRIWNSEGGEVEACGNASRCIADLILNEGEADEVSIETLGGMLKCSRAGEGMISVDMGEPAFHWSQIPLAEEFFDTTKIELQIGPIDDPILHTPSAVNVGNPHAIFWVDDVEGYDLARIGPLLENHPVFPERANISLAHVVDPGHMIMKVWERGAGLTRACGTAACAGAVAAARNEFTGRDVRVTLPGGDLQISWRSEDDRIIMTGPFAYEFEGILPAPPSA